MGIEVRVELQHITMQCVRHYDARTACSQPLGCVGQSHLISPRKQSFVVVDEAVVVVSRHVRRIEEDEVTTATAGEGDLKVVREQRDAVLRQGGLACKQIAFVGNKIRLWRSPWNVEL